MPIFDAAQALEFEVLVARAARRGYFDIPDLAETWSQLFSTHTTDINNPRRIDLPLVTQSLLDLPAGFEVSTQMLVVPRLNDFNFEPIDCRTGRAGAAADGVMLYEAPFGNVSLATLACHVACLFHEQAKAKALLAEFAPISFAEVAFALGLDEHTLMLADAQTQGALLQLLNSDTTFPELHLHAEFAPLARRTVARKQALRIVRNLAEAGLAGRPLHIWLGDPVLTDCLSPYVRELRPVLWQWAAVNRENIGADIGALDINAGEDASYALLHDFLSADARLWPEKIAADQTVGITHYEEAGGYEIIDLHRLEKHLCDPRLLAWQLPSPAPVIMRLSDDQADDTAALLATLLSQLASHIRSISIVVAGHAANERPGQVVLTPTVMRWGGALPLQLPNTSGLKPDDFVALADQPVQIGAVAAFPAVTLIHVQDEIEHLRSIAWQMGHADTALALIHANIAAELNWAVVHTDYEASGRPTHRALSGHAAVAVALLRRIGTPVRGTPTAKPPSKSASSRRAIRIKA